MKHESNPTETTPSQVQHFSSPFASQQSSRATLLYSPAYNAQKDLYPMSAEKVSDPFKLLSSNQALDSSFQPNSHSKGDRYIPQRKLVKSQSMISEHQAEEQGQNMQQTNQRGVDVSDLYKKFVMSKSPKLRQTSCIQSFQNFNILKFATNTSTLQQRQINQEGPLSWTANVEKQKPRGRKINKMPVKVLDAPSLQDDYYLNLLDWGTQNFLAVGLSSSVYLWNAATAKVNRLCDLQDQNVTSVSWGIKESNIAIGGQSGDVQIWDINKMAKVRTFTGHSNRVSSLSWTSSLLSSGSRDKTILNRDLRDGRQFISCFEGHRQEVCGLKWSPDQQLLCSGGNDNKLYVWSPKSSEPVLKYCDHQAAVKAVAWSPHQHGMLVSGGGTADRTIRFRNTLTGTTTKIVDAGSQVCCLMFSKVSQQLVSTHGYQLNEINLWKLPSMSKVATLTGHSSRVLYLAMSADGSSIVTGAGDQTLRFWNLFTSKNEIGCKNGGLLQNESLFLR